MPEPIGLAGQIMHGPTADKMLQPQQLVAEAAAQQAALAVEQMTETKRRSVQETAEAEQDRIEAENRRRQERQARKGRKKEKQSEEDDQGDQPPPGRLIDVIV